MTDTQSETDQVDRPKLMCVVCLCSLAIAAPNVLGRFVLIENGISTNDFVLIWILPALFLILSTGLIVAIRRNQEKLGLSISPWFRHKIRFRFLWALALFIAISAILVPLKMVFSKLDLFVGKGQIETQNGFGALTLWYIIGVGTLVTPIVEEMFWRGTIQDILQRAYRWPPAYLTQAILFSLVHLRQGVGWVSVFVIGLVLGLWRWRKKSLVVPIVVHILFNCLHYIDYWIDYNTSRRANDAWSQRVERDWLSDIPDFRPEKNAWPYYANALSSLSVPSQDLDDLISRLGADNTDAKAQAILLDWISANEEAIEGFKTGASQPFYFRQFKEDIFFDSEASAMVFAVLARSKVSAAEGDVRRSVSDILASYQFGEHLQGPRPILEQLIGWRAKTAAIRTAFQLLEEDDFRADFVEALQGTLGRRCQSGQRALDFSAWGSMRYYEIEAIFTLDKNGNGHVKRSVLDLYETPNADLRQAGYEGGVKVGQAWGKLKRSRTKHLVDQVRGFLWSIQDRTPFELFERGIRIQTRLGDLAKDNIFVMQRIDKFEVMLADVYRRKTLEDGLPLVLALMQYRITHGNYPADLNELIRASLLDRLPIDPYSDSTYAYRQAENGFILYSMGPNFVDDGGVPATNKNGKPEGDYVMWPIHGMAALEP